MPRDEITSVLDEAADLGVKCVRITGGEPLLHPHVEAILLHAKGKKFSIVLNTTAEGITSRLMKTIIKTVSVAHVSLQGHDKLSNTSYTRSKLAFADKMKNIFLLKAYVPTLWLATVVTPAKLELLPKYFPLLKKLQPAAWLLQRPISDINEDLKQMDHAFYRALALRIMRARQQHINAFVSNPVPLCVTGNLRIGQEAFMGALLDEGCLRMVRSAKGYYKPSYFIDQNLGSSIKAAWDHPYMQELTRLEFLPELCRQCPVLARCRGGCRAMALRTWGTAMAPDPLFDPVIAQKALSSLVPRPGDPQTIVQEALN